MREQAFAIEILKIKQNLKRKKQTRNLEKKLIISRLKLKQITLLNLTKTGK